MIFSLGQLSPGLIAFVIVAVAVAVLALGMAALALRRPRAGEALFRTGLGGRQVSIGPMLVIPGLQQCRMIDLTVHRVPLSFRGPERPLLTRDQQLFDLEISLYYRLEAEKKAILQAMDHFSEETLLNEKAITETLTTLSTESVRAVAGECYWGVLRESPHLLKEQLGARLSVLAPGFVVDDIALDHLDKFPPEISPQQGTPADASSSP